MLVDTVVKRDLQLACQNVKDGQPIGSWNFRDDNAIRVEIHQSGEFKAHQSCVSQVRLGVRVNCTCCCWRNTHSKRTKLMESDQSMKLGGGLSMADDVDSFNRFDWLQWLGWLFELQSDRRSTYHGLAASFLPSSNSLEFWIPGRRLQAFHSCNTTFPTTLPCQTLPIASSALSNGCTESMISSN